MPYPPASRNAPTPPFDGTEACAGVGEAMFFTKDLAAIRDARKLCAGCPMLVACDTWSMEREEFGFWAGRTALERERIRKEQGLTLHRPEARGIRRPSVPKPKQLVAA
jgi:WhiB family transcriptional regulator, redox-sensing transcriptional regulator